MRGARSLGVVDLVVRGIIPAYAGSTQPPYTAAPSLGDHPRVCGEHFVPYWTPAESLGSSPRMRGAPSEMGVVVLADGIIPAYAGSTPPAGCRGSPRGDHPRVCGEHHMGTMGRAPFQGSSPRMRGAHVRVLNPHDKLGIIPAYAGSTRTCRSSAKSCRDHPRVCGEHRCAHVTDTTGAGSSPRMRGARIPVEHLRAWVGIIPAYAGSTCSPCSMPTR